MTVPDVELISLRFGRQWGAMPPLGPLSLVAALRTAGISCKLTDTQFDPLMSAFSSARLADWIRNTEAPILAFSVFNDAIPLLIATLDELGGELFGRRLVAGGPGVVGIAQQLMERIQCLEAVIVGEGETAFPLLIRYPDKAVSLPGVFSRDGLGKVKGYGRTPRENLDQLTPVEWSGCKGKGYTLVPWSTMRGCPFGCEFCEVIAFLGRKVTVRSVPYAIEDLERAIEALGVTNVAIVDDTFTVDKKRVLAVCSRLCQMNPKISYEIFSRADTLDIEMMQALAQSGCTRVFVGIDSGDDAILRQISKGLTIAEAELTIRTAAKFFEVTVSFIWGYPFESLEQFRAMLLFCKRLLDANENFGIWPQLHLLSPSAGTPIFEKFHNRLVFDPHHETLPLGRGRPSEQSFRQGFQVVLDVIRANPSLAAPFYHYETPCLPEKAAEVLEFNSAIDIRVGDLILKEFVQAENYVHHEQSIIRSIGPASDRL